MEEYTGEEQNIHMYHPSKAKVMEREYLGQPVLYEDDL
jgi:hypothetical protein